MARFDIQCREVEVAGNVRVTVAEICGSLDSRAAPRFQNTMDALLKKGLRNLVLDLADVGYINSQILGLLIQIANEVESRGGQLVLTRVRSVVDAVIEGLGLKAFFALVKDEETALRRFAKAADAFISYRREVSSEAARLVQTALAARGLSAFLDVEDLGPSRFDERLLREIEAAQNFVVVLTPGALDRCGDEEDWLRREIAHAIASERNIVPVVSKGFRFPPPAQLPRPIADLPHYNGVEYSPAQFAEAMDKLATFLRPALG